MNIATHGNMILAPNGRPAFLEALENNWYEGSRWSPLRSFVWFPVQDAKKDLDRYTRYELSKHSRYLYKNSPFIRGLIERLVTLTVGKGIKAIFKSQSNPVWAKKAQKWWKRKSKSVNLGARFSFEQYTRAVARARFVDGEAFSIKTYDDTFNFEDMVQAVESDLCQGQGGPDEQEKIVDGMRLNARGTITGYKFKDVEEPYPADLVIHHYTPNRPMQYRGETILAAAINTARDVDDILALEKQGVKEASGKKDIITTSTGELDPETIRSLRFGSSGAAGTPFSLPSDERAKTDYYKVKFGAESVVLKNGDTYTPHVSARPGSAWQGFMEFLANTICLSSNLPPSVLLQVNGGGTDVRRDLDIAQRVVEPWQDDIALELDDIIQYLIFGEIADGELKGAPLDWEIVYHFPPKINVDRGTAQQDRMDYQVGLMSSEEYHGRYGDDGDAYEAVVIEEVKRRKARILAAGFKDVQEFAQALSLDPKMFMSQPPEAGDKPTPKDK